MPDLAAVLSYRRAARWRLDPRSALLAVVVVNVVCLGAGFNGLALWARIVATALPLVLLLAQRAWVAAIACAAGAALVLAIETVGLDGLVAIDTTTWYGKLATGVALLGGWMANLAARFLPVVLMAWYAITTMRASELMGALGRLRIPRTLVIPLAVVLRMVPVFADESAAIGRAARTRGLRVGLARPAALINYRLAPLALRAVDISDDLTQAALTRGLGERGQRTCFTSIGFTWRDAVVVAWAVASVGLFAVGV